MAEAFPVGLNNERIRRIQHDIKNQLGGLKLYANFLKKRLSTDSELIEVIDKMTDIVATITQQVAQIREEGNSEKTL
jgi:nitrogen fixation/metabolism regulation signal transduction histidine kinase